MAADVRARREAEAALVARLVHEFLDEHAPTRLTESPHTLKSYRDAASSYLDYLESRGVTPDSLSRGHFEREWVEGWIAWLKSDRNNSNDTCNVRLGSLRALLEFMGRREPGMLYLSLEARLIERQQPSEPHVEPMSEAAVAAILDEPDTSTRIGRRDATFFTLVYSTACRLSEAAGLTVGRVHAEGPRPYVTVRCKGGGTRTLFLLPRAASLLRLWMREALGDDPADSALLFESPTVEGSPLTGRAWDMRFKTYARRARAKCPEVPEKPHIHQLRHSKATHWVASNDLNIVEVQHILGHRRLSTTMVYVDVAGPKTAEALATLEGEADEAPKKRWKRDDGTLRGACGLGRKR